MPTSVMPKGVEHHVKSPSLSGIEQMPTSVMPKGVEHDIARADSRDCPFMPTSVMPKGVEHQTILGGNVTVTACPPL